MDKRIVTILSIAGALSGVIALVTYFEGRKKRKLQEEIYGLDKQIKLLQLLDHQKAVAA